MRHVHASVSDILGYLGGSILAIQLVPQIYKVWKRKSASDISYGTLFLNIIGGSMVTAYGLLIHQPPVYATVICSVSCNVTLLITKCMLECAICTKNKLHNRIVSEHVTFTNIYEEL